MIQKLQGKKWFISVLTFSLLMSLGIKELSANALINISLTMDPVSSRKGVLCPGDRVELYCRHTETTYDPGWRVHGKGLPETGLAKFGGENGLPNHAIVEDTHTREVLRIDPLQPDFNGYTYTCLYSIRGEDVLSSPLSLNIAALPDLSVTHSATKSSITLMWNTNLSCFEADISSFIVMWSEINAASTNDTVKNVNVTYYTLTELKPGTTYEIRVFAQSTVGVLSSSVLYARTESESTAAALGPDGPSTGLIAGIVVACSIIVILLAVCGVTVGVVIYKNTKQNQNEEQIMLELN